LTDYKILKPFRNLLYFKEKSEREWHKYYFRKIL